MNKPEKYLEIKINSEKSSYYIKYNDVKLFSESSNSPITQTLPINHWTNSDINKLLISVNFRKNDPLEIAKQSKLEVSVFLRIKKNGSEKSYLVSKFDLSPSKEAPEEIASSSIQNIKIDDSTFNVSNDGNISIGPWNHKQKKNWIRFEQQININIDLPSWSYHDAAYLGSLNDMTEKDFFALRDELYEEYKKIWELMKRKELDKLLDLTEVRSREMDIAFHLSSGSKKEDMKKSLTTAFSNSDLYLDDLVDKESAQLNILANGRIVNIKVAGTTEPPIYFSHKRESFTRFYDLYFMKKDEQWIIVR